jgi:hypothetical protein
MWSKHHVFIVLCADFSKDMPVSAKLRITSWQLLLQKLFRYCAAGATPILRRSCHIILVADTKDSFQSEEGLLLIIEAVSVVFGRKWDSRRMIFQVLCCRLS